MVPTKPAWECPRCGAKLVSRNLSHACGPYSVERFLAGKGAKARELFTRFVRLIASCGSYELAPAKTRVAFMAQVRFASVNRVSDRGIDVHFVLPRALVHQRFRRVEHLGPVHVHHLRLTAPGDFDAQLKSWLRASYREYGQREWLRAAGRSSSSRPSRFDRARRRPAG
jgi:hypothetical protein